MGKSYTSTINVRAWKEHTCVGCGGAFAYVLARDVTGTAPTAEAAETKARNNVAKTLATDVDEHPCPGCGLYQPDMIGQRRSRRHFQFFVLALVAFAVLLILKPTYAVQSNTISVIAAVVAAVVVAGHLLADARNPNKDLEANRRTANERVAAGTVRLPDGGAAAARGPARPPTELAAPQRSLVRTVSLALLLVGLGLVVMPEALRAARGWAANGNLYPPVVGPGDTTRVYMNEKIESVKGYWRGTPRVTATVPGGPPIQLECSTNQKDWGSSISAKSSEKSSSSTLWVELTMPQRPELADTTVKCDVALDVVYPKSVGNSTFDEIEKTITQPIEIRTASANAGGLYDSTWWLGTAGGAGLILVCGQILRAAADAYAKQARPTRTFA